MCWWPGVNLKSANFICHFLPTRLEEWNRWHHIYVDAVFFRLFSSLSRICLVYSHNLRFYVLGWIYSSSRDVSKRCLCYHFFFIVVPLEVETAHAENCRCSHGKLKDLTKEQVQSFKGSYRQLAASPPLFSLSFLDNCVFV